MNIFQLFKQGQDYANTWLMHPKLNAIFPENRVIRATKFAQKLMPFIAVFAVVWQHFFSKGYDMAFSVAILTAVFALCLPLQGLYWLGKRANTLLPPQSAVKFQQIFVELTTKGVALSAVEKPTYQDLAVLLQKAEQHLSAEFWDNL